MLAFLDFEASSLGDRSYPIEIAWVFADGTFESYLIRPAAAWTDWSPVSQAIHGIGREVLLREGEAHGRVAARTIEALAGHDLVASAPSWDGKWLSALLRAAGYPRRVLQLRRSADALREAAADILRPRFSGSGLEVAINQALAAAEAPFPPAHRALADAHAERQRWISVRLAAERIAQTCLT
ncbi:transcriptional regulator [Novosphingobium sp. JCM 18896]|uniref:3'-5' exonuclease n=1 Tax=Novosphingobium sp. JCM 18896 TaxID=2989731 RepID=UPI002222AC98|nr:transcriptional regulator [Novosphingobium sp. JCM 18896]MCW1430213.1 transcriptional regulator [Novosphingobium sp. JCM 18896]